MPLAQGATGARFAASHGVHPLYIGGLREPVPTGGPAVRSHHLEQQPGNRSRLHGIGIRVGCDGCCPDRAGIPGVLPRGTGHAALIRVEAQKMGGDLPIIVVEQGGLRPEKSPDKAGAGGEAYVVLGARGVSPQERPVPRWHLEPRWARQVG